MRILILSILVLSNVFVSSQTVVPFLKKNGNYIYVYESTMKPVSNQEFNSFTQVFFSGLEKDKNGNLIIPPPIYHLDSPDDLETFSNDDGWYGYKNKEGKVVIPCIYEEANLFSEDRAFVRTESNVGGYIDTTGKMIFSFKGKLSIGGELFIDGLARINLSRLRFFVDKEGNIKLILIDGDENVKDYVEYLSPKPIDKSIFVSLNGYDIWGGNTKYGVDLSFNEGLLGVSFMNKTTSEKSCAFIDKSGNFIIPIKNYEFERGFINGYAVLINKDGKEFYIDKNGREFLEK